MLGAGGLVRAYTDGAVAGIEAAGPVRKVLHRELFVTIDYTWLGKAENELRNRGTLLGETQFTDKVTLVCKPEEEEAERFAFWMTDLTQGQSSIQQGDAVYIDHHDT
ncbi:hypothetical protein D3C71_1894300 [compost metagenome]